MNDNTDFRPAIILIGAQMGENIGACARAMMNCGLAELRLVAPRDGWPNPAANAMASGADRILDEAKVYATTREAVADLRRVYATTARIRDMVKPVLTPHQVAKETVAHAAEGVRSGILFGPEKAGLENEDVALSDAIVNVPLNPEFTSLNLAQAVLLISYEWFQAQVERPGRFLSGVNEETLPPRRESLDAFFDRLVTLLDERGYFRSPDMREKLVHSIHNLFERMDPSEQDLRTLHGIIVALGRNPASCPNAGDMPDD
jgi:tRNA/rRNA methyltransferase